METNRIVHCADALEWLKESPVLEGCSIVASLPDISEFPKWTLTEWKNWFMETVTLVLSKCPDNGVTVFYQTDIKVDGIWVDKGYLCQKAAEAVSHELLWHKLICRAPAGSTTFGRPAYSHILCFSKGVRVDISRSTADILPNMGDKTWERGMGTEACKLIARFILNQTETRVLVHPFCGEGAMLAVANDEGLNAIGIERSPKRVEKARSLKFAKDKFEPN